MQMKPVSGHDVGACQFPCSHSSSSPWGHFLNPRGSYTLVEDSEACLLHPYTPTPTPNLLLSLSLSHAGTHMGCAPEDGTHPLLHESLSWPLFYSNSLCNVTPFPPCPPSPCPVHIREIILPCFTFHTSSPSPHPVILIIFHLNCCHRSQLCSLLVLALVTNHFDHCYQTFLPGGHHVPYETLNSRIS